jgi:hypothetical protein
MGNVRYGFAVRCAAVALPRRKGAFYILGYALVGPLAQQICAVKQQQGHSPKIIPLLSAGQSHRRTSGGRAETGGIMTFESKPVGGMAPCLKNSTLFTSLMHRDIGAFAFHSLEQEYCRDT